MVDQLSAARQSRAARQLRTSFITRGSIMTNQDQSRVRVILLAAGQGKRMKSTLPKVLHPVLGKSILSRVIDAVDALRAEHLHIVIGHEAEQVIRFLQNHPPVTPYSTHLQEPQEGTGHAVMQVVPALANFEGTLLVSVADTPLLTHSTLAKLVDTHRQTKSVVSLLTTKVDDPKNYGRILRDKQNNVVGIIEDKDASDEQKNIKEVNPAIYCFNWPAIKPGLEGLKNDNRQKEYYLTDLIGWAAKAKHKLSSALAEDWREVAGINSRLELAEAHRLLRDMTLHRLGLESGVTVVDPASTWISPEVEIGQDTTVLPGCHLVGNITIGPHCTIGPHTVMKGTVNIGRNCQITQSLIVNSAIGDNCTVGPFSHLRDGTDISSHVRIGNFCELKNTTVAAQTNVSHLSYVGDATVGSGTNIGAGTITANYSHRTKKKSRTVIGDNASTGSNSVLVAPVTLGDRASVAAGTVVTRDVPDGALAVGRVRQENREGWADKPQ